MVRGIRVRRSSAKKGFELRASVGSGKRAGMARIKRVYGLINEDEGQIHEFTCWEMKGMCE